MSYAAERWARAQRVGNARAKQVLVELANCHNGKTGKCTPGIKYLHEVTELKEDTISTATNFLQSKGFIKKTYVAVEKGRAISYELLGFNPQEWERKKTEDSTENGLTQNRGNPESVGPPETGATDSPENGGTGTPEFGGETGNKNRERNREVMCAPSGNSSANAAVASAQAQTLPTSFPQSSNSQNHSETKPAGKDSLPNASERSVAAHRDRPDTSDEQTRQNDAGCSQNASTRISGVCPENEPPPMSDEDLENLFANAQLEECPPFPEKGDHPSEKDAHLSSGDKKPARKKPATTAFCAVPRPDDVDPQVWDDWLTTRRAKRLPLTQTALNSVRREAASAGLTFQAAVTFAVEQGWAAFRAEWYRNATRKGDSTKTNARYLTAQERYEERMRKAGEMSDEEYFAQFDLPEEILNYEKAQEAKRHVAS